MALRFLNSGYFAGSVGIGTESPLKKLSVSGGDIAVNNGNGFIVGAAITGNTEIGRLSASSGQLQILTESTRDIKFGSTTYGNIMFLEGTNGNVGIGTTEPAGKLTIADTAFTTAYNSIKGLFFDNSNISSGDENFGAGIEFGKLGSGGDLYKKAAIIPVQSGTDSDQMGISFFVSNSAGQASPVIEAMRVDYGGNVGIGATTGFNAVSGTETTLYIKNTNVASLYLDSTANNGNKWGIYSAAAGQLAFYDFSDGSERMRITGTGDVGINTTSPDFKLDVDGTFGVSNLPFNSSSVSVLVADEITGAELVTNGSFANGSTDWSGSFSIANGVATYDATAQKNLFQSETLTSGLTYKLKFTISNTTGTGGRIWFGNSGGSVNYFGGSYVYYVNGTYEKVFTMPSTQTSFCFFALGNGTPAGQAFDISGISIKQVTSASNQIQKRELGTGAFGPTPVGAYLPLAGGTMTGNTDHNDNVYSKYGTADQLRIWNNGSNSYIFNYTSGNINIGNDAVDKDVIFYADRGDGLEDVFFRLDGSETNGTTVRGVTLFPDKSQARFGNQGDLRIYHDGSNSYIQDTGTGTLNLQGSTQVLIGGTNGEVGVQYVENAGVGLRHNNVTKLTTESTGIAVVGDIKIDSALLSNQENTDVDTGAEVVAQVAHATYTAAFFDFVVKKGTNVRSGTVYACHNGDTTPLVEFTETSTNDLGDTSDVTLSVDISGTSMRLLATVTSDDWSVKSLIRAI